VGSITIAVVFEFGSGSGKAAHDPLIMPGQRQTQVLDQLLCRQIARLPPIEDRLGDIRRGHCQVDEGGLLSFNLALLDCIIIARFLELGAKTEHQCCGVRSVLREY
jgi:hypothetical protein